MKSYRLNKLKRGIIKRVRKFKKAIVLYQGSDLNKLGELFGTDKVKGHYYTQHYMSHFKKYKNKPIKLLEIGVGGFENTTEGANSLKMWKAYFPKANIFSFDIVDKTSLQEERIKIFKGSQIDKEFLENMISEIGELDIIIDDGSHINAHVVTTFKILFPKLKKGGIYVIEDTQTSYWPDYGGDSKDLNNPKTMMNFFKGFTDCINHKEFLKKGYEPSYYDKHIISMHFYHNLIFIYKGLNDEASNMVVDNMR